MVNAVDNDWAEIVNLEGITKERLIHEQRSDPQWGELIRYLQDGPLPRKLPGNRPVSSFTLIDDI